MLSIRIVWLIRLLLAVLLLLSVPFFKWATWIRHYNALVTQHTISEKDLPYRYQLALNVSLAPLARGEECCLQADWQPNLEELSNELIPRIIHQTWKNETIPLGEWTTAHKLCKRINPEPTWQHILWTDASAREFVDTHYHELIDIFDAFPFTIQRVDAIRYLILHHYGGVYIDLDIGCARPMDALLVLPAFFPATNPIGISNDLIGAKPGHPIMKQLAESLLRENSPGYHRTFQQTLIKWLGSTYVTVFFSTGPMFVNFELSSYLTFNNDISILPPRFYSESLSSFFMHFTGSSWHGDDAHSVQFIFHHLIYIPFIALVILAYRRWKSHR